MSEPPQKYNKSMSPCPNFSPQQASLVFLWLLNNREADGAGLAIFGWVCGLVRGFFPPWTPSTSKLLGCWVFILAGHLEFYFSATLGLHPVDKSDDAERSPMKEFRTSTKKNSTSRSPFVLCARQLESDHPIIGSKKNNKTAQSSLAYI